MDIIFLIKTYKFKTQTSQQILGLFATNLFNGIIIGVVLYIFEKTKLSLDVMISFQINRM